MRVRGSVRALGVALELETRAVVDDRQPHGLEQLAYNQVRVGLGLGLGLGLESWLGSWLEQLTRAGAACAEGAAPRESGRVEHDDTAVTLVCHKEHALCKVRGRVRVRVTTRVTVWVSSTPTPTR